MKRRPIKKGAAAATRVKPRQRLNGGQTLEETADRISNLLEARLLKLNPIEREARLAAFGRVVDRITERSSAKGLDNTTMESVGQA